MPLGGRRPCTLSIQRPERSARAERFFPTASHLVSKRPIWLADAPRPETTFSPTIQRIAGSCRRRSASFTSSYPARRPNTDCLSKPTVGLLRQSVFGRLAGYEDVNDAERLRHDPAIRWIVGEKVVSGRGASASQMGRFETKWLAVGKNLSALADLSGRWIDNVHGRRPPRGIVLDMDSSVSPTHGEQEMSVWNGHYACTCYHPLFVFNQFGDLERCSLRPGNVHSGAPSAGN